MINRRTFNLTATAAALTAVVPVLEAQAAAAVTAAADPNRPISIIVPFAKNGTTDQIARMIAPQLAKALGHAVTVENITGDWGATGAVIAAQSAADGYTLIMGQTATHVSPGYEGTAFRYDAVNAFAPIGLVGTAPITFVARNDLPVNDLEALRAYIKVYPQPLAIVHGGFGTPSHIGARKLKAVFGTPLLAEKTYRSTMAALQDIADGAADMMATSLPQALPFIKAGKIKALGLAATSRNVNLPDVYTGAQQGFADLRASHWNGLFAPKGLSAGIQQRLAKALSSALSHHVTQRQMRELGIHVPFVEQQGPEALARLQAREMEDLNQALEPVALV
jgi:tripartite-type tricarboxylate transporter receptor subunit TctC